MRIVRTCGAIFLVLGLGSGGMAMADAIDGDWCSPDETRSLSIRGPQIMTPGGKATEGSYSRHAFAYVVPEGEAGAGLGVDMDLLSETEVLVSVGGAGAETWHRCDLRS